MSAERSVESSGEAFSLTDRIERMGGMATSEGHRDA
jgi:hypothetical protein